MQSKATTVKEYLASLPEDRRAAISAVREVILKNLDKDYAEGMQYGAIGYYVPHSIFPQGYHCDPKQPLPFGGLGSQKNHMSLGFMCTYGNPGEEAWVREQFAKAGKKLDMGKVCIRFKKLDDLPLDVIGEMVRRMPAKKYIAHYEAAILTMNKAKAARAGAGKAGAPVAKKSAKKAVKKGAKSVPAKKKRAAKASR